ncbi:MAG: translation elongation factor 4 [Thermoflexales bacterium]|nr:translation elongation factor 4 [Thermoflexales bacterium]MCS7324423.1 translation elongation factor 4 [Thermoflexales bacterium]MCX7938763.1 translation elongation factor 4 [Thermoflexales bacterium]MDW8054024.1 translation elongation factor 4 [Anaerolineae bacterium]MDW8293122.1 translation elongation factor 4 [Anaerolineae bacterium]
MTQVSALSERTPTAPLSRIRNFCIIAHVDHGKSTLADRLIEFTGTVSQREMHEQLLDSMEIEREKGVTIKASAVRMHYTADDGQTYELNLIDTPGHVDFTYEVSRALNACEGALLVVDASQGIEAQTLANLYLALEANLHVIPVINKIDLPHARPDEVAQEVGNLLGDDPATILRISAKEGIGIKDVLERVVREIPPPKGDPDAPLQALIFDSHYDAYKGVVAYVRVVNGRIDGRTKLRMAATGAVTEPLEIGVFAPNMTPTGALSAGEVGYVATGLKSVRECRVGDTMLDAARPTEPLPGYKPAKPMVFASIFPTNTDDYPLLRDALEKLQLNDAALSFTPENSAALGFGFRVGFLGLFHMEIVQERLEREYDLDIVVTAPSVEYEALLTNGEVIRVARPADMPDPSRIAEMREPWMKIEIYTPAEYIGPIMDLVTKRRGVSESMEYLDARRVLLKYRMPLAEMIVDFYDKLKSVSKGYASLDYHFDGYYAGNLVKVDILVNGEPLDSMSMIVHRDDAYRRGAALCKKIKELIPRQLFEVPIQAAIGGKIIARETKPALRKDVLAKCYGGDVTRKRKLLEKQKEGKKRMKMFGSVEIPQEAFMAMLKLEE